MGKRPPTNGLLSIAARILAGSIHIRVLLAFVFGVVFLVVIVGLALFVSNLESKGFLKAVLAVVLALAAAGVMAVIPGFFQSELTSKTRGLFSMTGSFIAFVMVLYLMFRPEIVSQPPSTLAPTATGVIFQGVEDVIVSPGPEYARPTPNAWLAFEDYAWLDGWSAVAGAPEEMKIGGESLGQAPWIALSMGMKNPSPDHTYLIAEAKLDLQLFEPVVASSGSSLTIDVELVPAYLIPEGCDEPRNETWGMGPRGFEPPDADHFRGILPTSTSESTALWTSKESAREIPAKENKQFIVFVSANAPGKYEFSVNLKLLSTDGVTASYRLGPYKYVFLDVKTAQDIPKEFVDGRRCP